MFATDTLLAPPLTRGVGGVISVANKNKNDITGHPTSERLSEQTELGRRLVKAIPR